MRKSQKRLAKIVSRTPSIKKLTIRLQQQPGMNKIIDLVQRQRRKKNVVVVAVAGSSGAGKGTIAKAIAKRTNGIAVSIDNYGFDKERNPQKNYEVLESVDVDLLRRHINQLRQGQAVLSPVFDWKTFSRKGHVWLKSAPVIVIEGVVALDKRILDLSDVRVYLEIPKRKALERALKRDAKYYSQKQIINYFDKVQDPAYRKFLYPSKRNAHVVMVMA